MKGSASGPGLLLSGRILLGVITVTAAIAGFTLGYFVGKNAPSSATVPVARQSSGEGESPSAPPGQETVPKNEISSSVVPAPQNPSAEKRAAGAVAASLERSPQKEGAKEDRKAAFSGSQITTDSGVKTPSRERGLAEQAAVGAPASPDNGTAVVLPPARENNAGTAAESAGSPEDKVVYTVQAGAFRGQKDAEALKRKLEAKGYKVTLKKETTPKGLTFYKVRAGEFARKKEAAVLAIKLKKTDGLNAFATLRK
ncbi:MAG TPA: SPOR domain-containing protein [Thermodesulfovibrionales bacterium]|nr:SPOR domain-containing protein [Thermodesulfovibrionales bacterium]